MEIYGSFIKKYFNGEDSKKAKDLYKRIVNLNEKATRDALTGAKNRAEYNSMLESIASKKSRSRNDRRKNKKSDEKYAIFFDLNDLGPMNKDKKYGHDIGSQYIQCFYQYLRSTFRKDDQIFRYGGDEFIVVISDGFNENKLIGKLDKILKAYNVAYGFDKTKKGISFSEVIKNAENKMNDMKEKYKNLEKRI